MPCVQAQLREALGVERLDRILADEPGGEGSLRVMIADAMLARDKLAAGLRCVGGRTSRQGAGTRTAAGLLTPAAMQLWARCWYLLRRCNKVISTC